MASTLNLNTCQDFVTIENIIIVMCNREILTKVFEYISKESLQNIELINIKKQQVPIKIDIHDNKNIDNNNV